MKVLFIGDVMGKTGITAVEKLLRELYDKYDPDFVLANGENSADGRGMNRASFDELSAQGIDAFSMGNHLWDKKEIFALMEENENIIRPANYHGMHSGRGYIVLQKNEQKLAFVNLSGLVYLPDNDSPFAKADEILTALPADVKHILVDFHAEATSEKGALAWYLDGKVSAVLGTHTHVQTNDARILPKGTAFISDVGMTGARDSILGMDKDLVLRRFLSKDKVHLEVAGGDMQFNAVFLKLASTGKAESIEIINIILPEF